MFLLFALWSTAWAQDPTPPADPPPASSETDLARAKELYENGSRLYDQGLYAEAIVAFKEAYALSKRPALLFNIANSEERLGNLQATVDTLNLYRAYAKAEEAESLDRRISTVERRIAEQKAEKDAAAAAAAAAVVPVAPVIITPPPAATKTHPRSVGLAVVGGTLGVAGGATALVTFLQSRQYIDDGDQAAWDAARPINNGALVVSGLGAALFIVGILPVTTPVADLRVGPTLSMPGIGAAGRF